MWWLSLVLEVPRLPLGLVGVVRLVEVVEQEVSFLVLVT